MTIHQSAFDESQGSPNLGAMQYEQQEWGPDQISGSLQVAKTSIVASGTAGVAAVIPVGAEIVDMVVHAVATAGGGTVRLRIGSAGANISDAVTMATAGNVTRCASLVQASKVVGAAGVEFVTAADTNLGDVYLYYKK
jgi:hypothetical protein